MADPIKSPTSGSARSQCWWVGMYPRANQFPQSISLSTTKRPQGSMVPPHSDLFSKSATGVWFACLDYFPSRRKGLYQGSATIRVVPPDTRTKDCHSQCSTSIQGAPSSCRFAVFAPSYTPGPCFVTNFTFQVGSAVGARSSLRVIPPTSRMCICVSHQCAVSVLYHLFWQI